MFKKTVLFCFVFAVSSFVLPQSILAIAQMTEPIVIENVMRGQEFVKTLSLFNSKDEVDTYGLEGSGEVENWVTFYDVSDINFENPITQQDVPSKSYQDVKMQIIVPTDIPNGQYIGQAVVFTMPSTSTDETDGVSIQVRQKVGREIDITVTDEEIVDLFARVNPVSYDIEEGEELSIKVTYENQGNILLTPSIGLKIINTQDNSTPFEAVFPYPSADSPVGAKLTHDVFVKWQTVGEKNGRYQADIKIILDNEVIQTEDFRFNLGPIPGGKVAGLATVAKLGGGNLVLGWIVIGIILLIIAGILIFINKRRN